MKKIKEENQWFYDKLQEIKNGDISNIDTIKKELIKKCGWDKDYDFMLDWDFLENEYLEIVDNKRKVAFFYSMKRYFWSTLENKKEGKLKFLFKVILEEKQGNVRNRARDFFEDLMRGYDKKKVVIWIKKVEKEIFGLAPEYVPFAIENEKPSAYKTLVLIWHELDWYINGEVNDADRYFENLEEKKIPRLYDFYDSDSDGEEMEFNIINNTWDNLNKGKATLLIQRLNNFALQRWVSLMKEYGFKAREIESIKSDIKKSMNKEEMHSKSVDGVFAATLGMVLNKNEKGVLKLDIDKYNILVRDFQSYSNHCLWKNVNEDPLNQFMVSALLAAEMEQGRKIKNPLEFLEFSLEVKEEGERFLNILEDKIIKSYEKMADEYKGTEWAGNPGFWDDKIEDSKKEMKEMKSIFQHTADWYLIQDYWDVKKRGTNKAIAVIISFILRVNIERNKYLELNSKLEMISEFGGWKSVSSVKSVRGGLEDLFYSVPDPRLFIVFESGCEDID